VLRCRGSFRCSLFSRCGVGSVRLPCTWRPRALVRRVDGQLQQASCSGTLGVIRFCAYHSAFSLRLLLLSALSLCLNLRICSVVVAWVERERSVQRGPGTNTSNRRTQYIDNSQYRSVRNCCVCVSSLGRSLLPLWYLPALTKVHRPLFFFYRPLFENFAKFTAVEKMSSKMFSGQYQFTRLNAPTCRRPVAMTARSTEPPGEPLPQRLGAAVVGVVGGPRDMDMAC